MLHEVEKIGAEELGACLLITGEFLEQVEQNVEANLRHIAHGVLEGPYHRVHQHFELGGRNLEESWRGRKEIAVFVLMCCNPLLCCNPVHPLCCSPSVVVSCCAATSSSCIVLLCSTALSSVVTSIVL